MGSSPMAVGDSAPVDKSASGNSCGPASLELGTTESTIGQMKKSIGALTMISICFNICNSWAGLNSSTQIALLQGGPSVLLYGMIISASMYMAIALTIGELASVYPTAGGQYHFASILAPRRFNRIISYMCGVLTMFSWIAIGAAILIVPSTQIVTLATYFNPSYEPKSWHLFFIYEAFGLIVYVYCVLALKKLPRTHDIGFALTISMFLVSVLTIFIRSSPKASHSFVWTKFSNSTGWPDGACFFTGLLTTCFIFAGLDASLHMAEEAPNPRKSVPRAAVNAIGIGFTTAFIYGIALLYSIADFEAIIEIEGYLPFEINRRGMRSDTAAVTLLIAGIIMTFFIMNAVLETSSRVTWAFARDNAIIFAPSFGKIHSTLDVPVNAITLNWAILVICGFIFLASSTAFNALLGSCVTLQLLSFLIPTLLVMYQRRSKEFLPDNRQFKLPHWFGWACHIWVAALVSVLIIFFMFPPFLPVDASSMNYNVVILGIVFTLGGLNWFSHGRKHYQGPRIIFHG